MANQKRYFFLVYTFWLDKDKGKGNMTFSSNIFPKHDEIKNKIKEDLFKKYGKLKDNTTIVIENWIEMTEIDYKNFNI